jgi:hypothetical protein
MNKVLIVLVGVLLFAVSCSKDGIDKNDLTYDDFKNHLTSEMDYDKIVRSFGKPSKDIGSGIHIYVYELNDLTEIWIGYIDEIVYAKHLDENQQELDILIE